MRDRWMLCLNVILCRSLSLPCICCYRNATPPRLRPLSDSLSCGIKKITKKTNGNGGLSGSPLWCASL
uniref:Putative secreted protein n=1 Tax=Anopheles marajoara TaxID=58244 RepID=A0A2M4CF62_9DIPT